MNNIVFRKSMIIGIIILFIGGSVGLSTSENNEKLNVYENNKVESYNGPKIFTKSNLDISADFSGHFNNFNMNNIIKGGELIDQYQYENDYWALSIWYDNENSYQWVAQSFKPVRPTLTRIKLLLGRWEEPWCDLVMSIRDDINGEDLVTISKNYNEIPEDPSWVEFDIPDISVNVGQKYFIVCKAYCGMWGGEMYLWFFGEYTQYERGEAWWIGNYTNEWGTNYVKDCCFETYGIGGNLPPFTNFTWTPQNPDPREQVTFNASNSYDLEGTIVLYEWDWNNDGIYNESSPSPTINHSWSQGGSCPVTLRVTDNGSLTDNMTKTVHVNVGIPNVEKIRGGFRVSADILNIGNGTAINVHWSIDLNGGFVPFGSHTDGVIASLAPDETKTVRQSFLFGIGWTTITVQAGDSTKTANGFVLGPLVLGVT